MTVLMRGSNKLVLDEAERSVHDALCVVRSLVSLGYRTLLGTRFYYSTQPHRRSERRYQFLADCLFVVCGHVPRFQ